MVTVKLSSKGQLVLPKKIRDEMKIRRGSLLQISLDGDRIVLEPMRKSARVRLRGKYRNEPLLEALETEHGEEVSGEVGS